MLGGDGGLRDAPVAGAGQFRRLPVPSGELNRLFLGGLSPSRARFSFTSHDTVAQLLIQRGHQIRCRLSLQRCSSGRARVLAANGGVILYLRAECHFDSCADNSGRPAAFTPFLSL